MTTDLDALIAEARSATWPHEEITTDRYVIKLLDDLTDALEQERERAEHFREGVRAFGEQIRDMGIALSRTEATIEKVRNRYHRYASQEEQAYDEEVDALQDIAGILIEYDKRAGGRR